MYVFSPPSKLCPQRSSCRALPAFTIHTAVAQAKKAFGASARLSARAKLWGPTLTGLAIVPLLPYLYDHPVEIITDIAGAMARDWLANAPLTKEGKDEM